MVDFVAVPVNITELSRCIMMYTLAGIYIYIYIYIYLRAAAPAADPCGPGPLLHHAGQVPEGRDRDH